MLITDTHDWRRKIQSFSDPQARIAIISDFDYTITPFNTLQGDYTTTSVAYLRRSGKMSARYAREAESLAKTYIGYESHPHFSYEEKFRLTEEWYSKHFQLMFEEGLHENILEPIMQEDFFSIREGFRDLLSLCSLTGIPFIVMSAGLADVIDKFLVKEQVRELVHVVGNMFEYDRSGRAVSIKGDIIHPYTKNCVALQKLIPEMKTYNPTHVVVMGDHIGDAQMATCFADVELIKVGFLDNKSRHRLEEYQKHFDIVFFGNDGIAAFNEVVKECIGA